MAYDEREMGLTVEDRGSKLGLPQNQDAEANEETLVFQHGLLGVPVVVIVGPPAFFHTDDLAAVRAHHYFPLSLHALGIRGMQLAHDIVRPLGGRRGLRIGITVLQ